MHQGLIIGNRGMLGQALALRGAARGGWSLRGLDMPGIDITDAAGLAAHPALDDASVWFNCAGFTDVEACEDREAEATRINGSAVGLLAAEARRRGARLVHISTDYVFDGTGDRPIAVDTPAAPLSAYVRSNAAG